MLNGAYVAPTLLFIAALFGVLALGIAIGRKARSGTRLQLLLAWLLALVLLPPWILALASDDDIFGVVRIARYALAVPALGAVWWLWRAVRAFKARRPALAPLPRKPWLLVLGALALFGLEEYLARHRYDFDVPLNDGVASLVLMAAAVLLLAGSAWALHSSLRWLRLAGPGSAAPTARR